MAAQAGATEVEGGFHISGQPRASGSSCDQLAHTVGQARRRRCQQGMVALAAQPDHHLNQGGTGLFIVALEQRAAPGMQGIGQRGDRQRNQLCIVMPQRLRPQDAGRMQHLVAQVQGDGQITLADRIWRVMSIKVAAACCKKHIARLQLYGLPGGGQALGTMQPECGAFHLHGLHRVRQLGLDMQAFTGERAVGQRL